MADYKKIDLQIGTEEQFEEKKLSLPVGTLVGITDPIHESELDTDLQTKINEVSNKLTAPTTPTAESAVTMLADGTVGTKLLSEIGGGGGVQFVELFPGSTLTPAQLTILKANKGNQIIYYGGVLYYFKLAYEKSSNEWLYVTFYDSAVTLTVNMTTGSATLDTSGKLYKHLLNTNYSGSPNLSNIVIINNSSTEITELTEDVMRNIISISGNYNSKAITGYSLTEKYIFSQAASGSLFYNPFTDFTSLVDTITEL